jgi:hypothetical protein
MRRRKNEMRKIIVFVFICLVSGLFFDCANRPAAVFDTGDFERLRYQYKQLRGEYNRLQSDYSKLVSESQFYANYYRNATEAIASGIRELGELGSDSIAEIAKIRANIAILRNIVQSIIDGESGERQPNTET